ncbi:RICIN domain-containing protein [Streptomyces sp. 8N706]|uniref:RICIN domain-containing protein n=1 Tax=Streptomyces sp. 8N706 TaxID=3457416 RepID=UPI003FD53F09
MAAAMAVAAMLTGASPAQAEPGWIRVNAFHSNLVATVKDGSTANSAQVVQQPFADNAWNGQWRMVNKGNETWQFENRWSHQCLDVRGKSTAAGADIVQLPCDSHRSQQWIRWQDPTLPVWHIWNRHSGMYLTVQNAATNPGVKFVQQPYSAGAANQMMQIW